MCFVFMFFVFFLCRDEDDPFVVEKRERRLFDCQMFLVRGDVDGRRDIGTDEKIA